MITERQQFLVLEGSFMKRTQSLWLWKMAGLALTLPVFLVCLVSLLPLDTSSVATVLTDTGGMESPVKVS